MSPLSGGQRRQASIMASLGGSSVEECAEAFADLNLLIGPFSGFSHNKKNPNWNSIDATLSSGNELADQHHLTITTRVSQSVTDTHSSVDLRN